MPTQSKQPSADELLKRIADLEDKLQQAEARATEAPGARIDSKSKAFTGDNGGYEFKVTPIYQDQQRWGHLKEAVIPACDESEAKRHYLQSNETRPKSGKPLDPLSRGLQIKVQCIDPRRHEAIQLAKRLAHLRQKLNTAATLTAEEQKLLNKYESDILGF